MKRYLVAIVFAILARPSAAQLTFPGVDTPEPERDEVVGILYGKTYLFGDLSPTRAELRDHYETNLSVEGPTFVMTLSAGSMRSRASSTFMSIAKRETLENMLPQCGLLVSNAEVSEYVDWWSESVRRATPHGLAAALARRFSHVPTHRPIDEIVATDPVVAGLARQWILSWKQDRCIYHEYGGGDVQRTAANKANNPLGWKLTVYYELPVMEVHPAVPLAAYRAHYAAAMANGDLSFPDPRYADAFFWRFRDSGTFAYYGANEAAEYFNIPYWTKTAP